MDKIEQFIEKVGNSAAWGIIHNAHPDAVYHCTEWNEHFKCNGYETNKFIVGIHNPKTHFKLSDLKEKLQAKGYCDHCFDGDESTVFPYIGLAPHKHTVDGTEFLDESLPENFSADPGGGTGVYTHCLVCGADGNPV